MVGVDVVNTSVIGHTHAPLKDLTTFSVWTKEGTVMSARESGEEYCRILLDHMAIGIQIVQLLYNGQGEPAVPTAKPLVFLDKPTLSRYDRVSFMT